MEAEATIDSKPNIYRWTRTRAEIIQDRAERSARRKSMLLDMAGFALAVYANEDPDPLARRIKKRIVGSKLASASRWRRLL